MAGYYLENRRCSQCKGYCTLYDISKCTSCQEGYILKDGDCHDITIVERCIQAKNNTCFECSDGYQPSDDGLSCLEPSNLSAIVGGSVGTWICM